MIKLKGFVTRDDFIIPSSQDTSSIYELSSKGMTYSRERGDHFYTTDPRYSLKVFKLEGTGVLTQEQADNVIKVVSSFTIFLPSIINLNKQSTILLFTSNYNTNNPDKPVTSFTYNNIIESNLVQVPDYVSFVVDDMSINLWLNNSLFESFYPDYDIDVILPFDEFQATVGNPGEFLNHLNDFGFIKFNNRIDAAKSKSPTTYTRILNIPYKVGNTDTYRDCHFGFNIYGGQGNYEHILKLELYRYLTEDLGMIGEAIQALFPTLLNVNEFFVIPRWDNLSITGSTGISSIGSQVVKAYTEVFDINKFIKVYNDDSFLRKNTYVVPFDYNNLNIHIVNGLHTDEPIRDFKEYYKDFMSVPTTHPDFGRMKQKTQRLVTMLENMLEVTTCSDSTELFNKIQQNTNYNFSVITRSGITYVSHLHEEHQFYAIPRYEFIANQ